MVTVKVSYIIQHIRTGLPLQQGCSFFIVFMCKWCASSIHWRGALMTMERNNGNGYRRIIPIKKPARWPHHDLIKIQRRDMDDHWVNNEAECWRDNFAGKASWLDPWSKSNKPPPIPWQNYCQIANTILMWVVLFNTSYWLVAMAMEPFTPHDFDPL